MQYGTIPAPGAAIRWRNARRGALLYCTQLPGTPRGTARPPPHACCARQTKGATAGGRGNASDREARPNFGRSSPSKRTGPERPGNNAQASPGACLEPYSHKTLEASLPTRFPLLEAALAAAQPPVYWEWKPASPRLTARGGAVADGGAQDVDPVLVHLMRNARSSSVQNQFLKVPKESYTKEHGVKLLVRVRRCPHPHPPTEKLPRTLVLNPEKPERLVHAFRSRAVSRRAGRLDWRQRVGRCSGLFEVPVYPSF